VDGMASMSCDDLCVTFVQPALLHVNTTGFSLSHYCIMTRVWTYDV
jgi:hypothetical protein